jgi:hypothetical protein
MRLVAKLVVAAMVLGSPVWAQVGGAGLAIAVSEFEVTVSGASAGGSVLVFGVVKRSGDYVQLIERHGEILADSDADGIVSLTVADGVPEHGAWFAFDESSEKWTAWPAEVVAEPPSGEESGEGGEQTEIVWTNYVEAMILRSQSGAWVGAVGDGGPSDLDGLANGTIVIDPASLEALTGSNAPDAPATPSPGDLVVTVDPDGLVLTVEPWN